MEIAETFRVSPGEMLFIGDEKKDMDTAKRFGCKSVLLDWRHSGAAYGQNFTVNALVGIQAIELNEK